MWRADLVPPSARRRDAGRLFVQPCVNAVTMGDTNAALAVEHAIRIVLQKAGCLIDDMVFARPPNPEKRRPADSQVHDVIVMTL